MLAVQLTRILKTREEARAFAVQFARHFRAIYIYEHPKSKPKCREYSVVRAYVDGQNTKTFPPMKVSDKRLEKIEVTQ